MVNLYVTLIIKKRRTFESVPDNLKTEVQERLAEQGYDTNGDPLN